MAVVKSPNDPRDYRVIHLDNGLTALLISDTNTVSSKQQHSSFTSICSDNDSDDNSDDEQESHDEDDASDDDDDEDEDDDDVMVGDEQENEDNNDIHDGKKAKKDAKLAAAALCIGVGSFSDPEEIPGLAHFLEHMVFMGSKKYPEENAFDAFINKHGGSSNAATDCERTVFVFDIRRKYFKEALDRFAQFFIDPLMKEGSVDREIEAVESEFMQSYQSDTVKKLQLLQSLARNGHPLKKFLWGSKETLKNVPAQKGIDVQAHLRNFQKRLYSSHYMTLAVCSKESLDSLEELVKECFTDIPNNGIPVPTFEECTEPFDDTLFCKLYKVIPVKDFHQIEVTWMLPCQYEHYRIKPMHYISWLLGHEGVGSVLSLLIKKSWAVSLMCGNGETGIEHCSNYAMFPVMVILTDDGMEHIFEILTIIFQYLEMLRKEGPQERIYKEIQTIENNEFRFQEQCEPYSFTENVVENMQLYTVEDFLTGDQLMWEYRPEVISQVLSQLVPHKANIMISSKNFKEEECNEVETWFQTNYKSTDIDPSWLESWKNIQLNPDLHLPAENTYIATDFEIKDKDILCSEYPVVVLQSDLGKLWHRRDNKFHTPRARYYFHLISPNVNNCPKSVVLTEMFLKVLEYNLKEISYSADVAQLSYSMSVHERGIVLKLDGFNHKLPLLFETIVRHFVDFEVTEQIFDVVKEQLSRNYRNTIIKPSRLVRTVRLAILQLVKWTIVEKEGVIESITIDDLKNFAMAFKSELYFESLIQGNVTVDEAIALQQHLYEMVNPSPLMPSFHPEVRVVELPATDTVCRIPCFNKDDANSIVIDYYQSGPGSVEDYAMMELLVMKMEEPCFDILRTREQLGYSVYCTCRNTFGVLGFSVTVQTQADKFSVDHVQARIDAFLEEFQGILVKMKQADFKSQVDALIELKQHEDLNLADEANRNWYEILDQTYLFDRKEKEIDALHRITKEDIVTCFKRHIKNGDKFKKLSVQIAGSGDTSSAVDNGITADKEDGTEEKHQWILRPMFVESKACIIDIAEFKQTRPVFPVSKIV